MLYLCSPIRLLGLVLSYAQRQLYLPHTHTHTHTHTRTTYVHTHTHIYSYVGLLYHTYSSWKERIGDLVGRLTVVADN